MFCRARSAIAVCALLTALSWTMIGASLALANPGGNDVATAIPATLPLAVTGSLDASSSDVRDVYAITLAKGQTLDASMLASAGTDFDLFLYKGVTSIDETTTWPMMWSAGPASAEHFTFMAADAGIYYLDMHAFAGASSYTLDARIIPAVEFKISGLKVPKLAKKGKKVTVSAVVTPAYNGWYGPAYLHFYRWERGKYRQKAMREGSGSITPTKFSNTYTVVYKFPKKGKWRVRAEFWDEAHASRYTTYKYITIR